MTGEKILIVDDDKGLLKLIVAILKRSQYNVISADNGKDALSLLETEKPDLVLLDLLMPEMSGFEVLDLIRAHDAEQNEHTRVLLLTAHSQRYALSTTESGAQADGCISKPVTAAKLAQELEHYLNQ